MYAAFTGYVVQAVLVNLAPLFFVTFQQEFGIGFEQIGRLVLVNFCTQLVTDVAAIRFAGGLGYRRGLMLAHIFATAGLLMMGTVPRVLFVLSSGSGQAAYAGLMGATMVYAVGGGLIEVLMSPMIEALPSDDAFPDSMRAAAMSLLHSFYAWGQLAVCLITTLLLCLTGTEFWWGYPLAWALLPLVNLFFLARVPMPDMREEAGENGLMPLRSLFSNWFFWIAMVLMISAGASELAMSQWSSLFAERGLGVSKVVGDLLGPCMFAVFMGIGRAAYGKFGGKLELTRALLGCALLCILCYSLTVFMAQPVFSFLGCAVCGLSISLMWPGTLSLTARKFPRGGTPMFGLLAMCGDIGCSVGPWLTGIVSDMIYRLPGAEGWGTAHSLTLEQLGLKAGLAAAMVFPLLMLLGVAALKRVKPE